MRILSLSISTILVFTISLFCMENSPNEQEKDKAYEGYLTDVRWFSQEWSKDIELYKKTESQNLFSFKGLCSSYWNLVGVTKMPAFFVIVHALKFSALMTFMKAFIHMNTGIPETDTSFYVEAGISGLYTIAESVYITWANKDKPLNKVD